MDTSPRISRFLPAGIAAVLLLAACDSPNQPVPPTHVLQITPDSVSTLHRGTVAVEAFVHDASGHSVEPAGAFAWTSSDVNVAEVDPVPDAPMRAVISTRGPGAATIRVTNRGATAEMVFHVAAAIDAQYTVTWTGLPNAAALNDWGEVAAIIRDAQDRHRLVLWVNGRTREWEAEEWRYRYATVRGINNSSSILVSSRHPPCSPLRPCDISFLVREGVITPVQPFAYPSATDVNDRGAVVGNILMKASNPIGFFWADERTVILRSDVFAVNNRDQVVGSMWLWPEFAASPFLWEDGQHTVIPAPDAECPRWVAVDINDRGSVLLECWEMPPYEPGQPPALRGPAALWNGAGFAGLGAIHRAMSINNHGEVVGSGPEGTYLWRNGQAVRLWDAAVGAQINNARQILLDTEFGAFLLQPDP